MVKPYVLAVNLLFLFLCSVLPSRTSFAIFSERRTVGAGEAGEKNEEVDVEAKKAEWENAKNAFLAQQVASFRQEPTDLPATPKLEMKVHKTYAPENHKAQPSVSDLSRLTHPKLVIDIEKELQNRRDAGSIEQQQAEEIEQYQIIHPELFKGIMKNSEQINLRGSKVQEYLHVDYSDPAQNVKLFKKTGLPWFNFQDMHRILRGNEAVWDSVPEYTFRWHTYEANSPPIVPVKGSYFRNLTLLGLYEAEPS